MDRRLFIAGSAAALTARRVMAEPALERLYYNPLRTPDDVKGFVLEGEARVDFDTGRMRLRNARPASDGQASNFVYWCPEIFPDNVEFRWNFWPLEEPGLCIFFFAAQGLLPKGGTGSLFDKRLKSRAGIYDQYTQSDVSALQMAYFRRRWLSERAFHLCNLRRAPGFELLAQAADPLPDVADATPPYRIRLQKRAVGIDFFINDLPVMTWRGGGQNWPAAGNAGFRQMAPLVAAYSDFEVYRLEAEPRMDTNLYE